MSSDVLVLYIDRSNVTMVPQKIWYLSYVSA